MPDILVVGLTLAAGAGALWIASRLRRDGRKSRNWPAVTGKIVECGIESLQSDARSFTPRVTYSYTVAGKEYVGRKVYRTGQAGRMEAAAQLLAGALPEAIPVHYNPEDPHDAYLLADPAAYYWITLAFGVGALIWGMLQALAVLTG